MKKMYIFDLDGTLINSLPAIAHFANTALASIGLDPIDNDTFKYYIGDGMDTLLHRCLRHYDADNDENFTKIKSVYKAGYDNDVLYETYPYDGIKELLGSLKESGAKICMLSNKPDVTAVRAINILFGENYFDIVLGQRDNIPKKPAPDGVFLICEKTGIPACDTAFIGDTNVDILTGKAAGTAAVGVLWGFREKKELTDAGADEIVSAPLEILDLF